MRAHAEAKGMTNAFLGCSSNLFLSQNLLLSLDLTISARLYVYCAPEVCLICLCLHTIPEFADVCVLPVSAHRPWVCRCVCSACLSTTPLGLQMCVFCLSLYNSPGFIDVCVLPVSAQHPWVYRCVHSACLCIASLGLQKCSYSQLLHGCSGCEFSLLCLCTEHLTH